MRIIQRPFDQTFLIWRTLVMLELIRGSSGQRLTGDQLPQKGPDLRWDL